MQDEEAFMFHYFLQKGHGLKELESLTPVERCFLRAGMELEVDEKNKIVDGLIQALEGIQNGKKY